MAWRVVITVEVKNQKGSSLMPEIKKCLSKCGITERRANNTWEGRTVTPSEAAAQLTDVLKYLADPKLIKNPKRAYFDHLWVYIDGHGD